MKGLLAVWLVFVPAGIAFFMYFGPEWIGLLAFIFSLWKAWRTWLRMTGRSKPSHKEHEKAERERKMQHYYYHCERNSIGFQKLMVENLTEEARQRVEQEAAQLAKSVKSK